MNTGASNVDFINIHQIKEFLSMSCIAYFEEWYKIFRNRSFTLCKNDSDFNEKSDSVAVSESISLSSMTNSSVCWVNGPAGCPPQGSPRSCFQHFIRFALLRGQLFVNIPF